MEELPTGADCTDIRLSGYRTRVIKDDDRIRLVQVRRWE